MQKKKKKFPAFAAFGRIGGLKKSAKKAAASRENIKKAIAVRLAILAAKRAEKEDAQ